MTFQQAVEQATAKLLTVSDSAQLDAQLLVCHCCDTELTALIAHPEKELTKTQSETFDSTLLRRAQGEPLAYITGTKEFWSLNLSVNQHVLIPRPETELLVELTLNKIANIESPHILELGTGSGAIAIALAHSRKDCQITATDISSEALEIASLNASEHNADIRFVHSDWYSKLTGQKFDVIVSNPPYVAEQDPNLNNHVTLFEPKNAVISQKNGLEDLAEIIENAPKYLKSSGTLLIEHGFQQAESVYKLFAKANFDSIVNHYDLAGNPRCMQGNL